MNRCVQIRHHIVTIPVILILLTTTTDAGASSTPKNLVNLYTHSPSDSLNFTGLNQFQNEYQYRQSSSKSSTSERARPAASPSSSIDLIFAQPDEHGCRGRLKLTGPKGIITDGHGNYQTNLQCSWVIDSGRNNSIIRIRFHQFNTECNYDYLYIFDGDSIYSPLVAALSGDMKDFNSALAEPKYQENAISNLTNYTNGTTLYSTQQASTSNPSQPFEIKTKSGKAFIYFHSDTAQSMPGFYITYTIDSCPLDCSNRGDCDFNTLTCKCHSKYYGEGCQHLLCPNNCTSPMNGICDPEKSCICSAGYSGEDCSISSKRQQWLEQASLGDALPARAFHQAIVVEGIMWIIGGRTKSFSNTNMGITRKGETPMVYSYNIETRKWSDKIINGTTGIDHLAEVSGHSVAVKGSKIFIYGGLAMNYTVMDTLTVLDTKLNLLTSLSNGKKVKQAEEDIYAPIAVVGHSANIIDGHMYIFLGYNPLYGYLNVVQKFNLADNSWSIVKKKGSSISGYIGHTSTYDANSRLVYLYGGHNALKSSNLYSFDPFTESWTFLHAGPSPRYYHSAVIVDGQLLILGGNSYNTSHQSDQCFQQSSLAYNLQCSKQPLENKSSNHSITHNPYCGRKCWRTLEDFEPNVLKRHGHTVAVSNRNLILFGGFNGFLLNDLRVLDVGSCSGYKDETTCLKPGLALECQWNPSEKQCVAQSSQTYNSSIDSNSQECSKSEIKSLQRFCENRVTCTDCLATKPNCVWCGFMRRCHYNAVCTIDNDAIVNPDLCYKDETADILKPPMEERVLLGPDDEMDCKNTDNCYLCKVKPHCNWQSDSCVPNLSGLSPSPQPDELTDIYGNNGIISFKQQPVISNSSRTFFRGQEPSKRVLLSQFSSSESCELPCYMRRSCNECTTSKCIWCSTTEQCIDSLAYFAYHPMGQCMHYVAHMAKCPVSSCSDIESCDKCLTNPRCGWLNDISNTGKGKCMDGTSNGPSFFGDGTTAPALESSNFNSTSIPSILSNWYYKECPACQCNGHSYCKPNSDECIQPCQDNTEGAHCERCIYGYYGDPVNGGTCRLCRCNGYAFSCNRETGKCYCSTKGIIGHNCNRCDDQNHYIGDAHNGPLNGTCYYNLTTDYQYTFNMSKAEDFFYTNINFINVPLRKDSDADFTIACSRTAFVDINVGTSYLRRKPIHTGLECGSFRLRFQHDRHFSSESNYSFFVHVYRFQTPFILQIAFSQHRTLYLPQFFFTFSSFFLFFFALSGLVWKAKHEYDLYVRRQRQFIEMEQMASRPFSTILLEMFRPTHGKTPGQPVRSPAEPTPISFEPCHKGHVGVLSFFVQLPGRPHLAIGSALVTLGDDANNFCDDNSSSKQAEKDVHNSVQIMKLN